MTSVSGNLVSTVNDLAMTALMDEQKRLGKLAAKDPADLSPREAEDLENYRQRVARSSSGGERRDLGVIAVDGDALILTAEEAAAIVLWGQATPEDQWDPKDDALLERLETAADWGSSADTD